MHSVSLGILVAGLGTMMMAWAACATPTGTPRDEVGNPPPPPAVVVPSNPVDYYRDRLLQLPLSLNDSYQNLSTAPSVVEDDAFLSGLYYRTTGGTRDLYALFSNDHVYRLDASDFALDWTVDLRYTPTAAPTTSDSHVYFLADGPRILTFFREEQAEGDQEVRDTRFLYDTPTSPLAATDQSIAFGVARDLSVTGYEVGNRMTAAWDWTGTGGVSTPIISDVNQIYFYSNDGHIQSLDILNGGQNWRWPFRGNPAYLLAPFRMKYGTLWFGDDNGVFTALDKSSAVRFQVSMQEPIVTRPFVQDYYYVLFQTPTRLICLQPALTEAGLRPASAEAIRRGQSPDDPAWEIPLVSDETAAAYQSGAMSMDEVMESDGRRQMQILMKGERWLYVLETLGEETRHLLRINAATGEFEMTTDSETGEQAVKRYDVSAFPYILQNDDDDNRTLYFATYEGYVFGMNE